MNAKCLICFGINFTGHPRLTRILMPKSWKGHPLRKEHHARATEMDPFVLTDAIRDEEEANLKFNPEEYGLDSKAKTVISLFSECRTPASGNPWIIEADCSIACGRYCKYIPDIGFHHRGAERWEKDNRGIPSFHIPIG